MTTVYYVMITDQCDFDRMFSTGMFASLKGAQAFIERERLRFNIANDITEETHDRYNGFNSTTLDYELQD